MRKLSLAAALIVKDEEANLPGCLESLQGLVDEVVVYDTGSTDATVEIAQRAGARVERGFWDGDFSRARNAALAMTPAAWVLSIDADERAVADPAALRRFLARSDRLDMIGVRITNIIPVASGGGHEHPAPRLLRRSLVRWNGRLHEQPQRRDGARLRKSVCPREALRLNHLGYADAETVAAKVRRNQAIAQEQLDAVVAGGVVDPEQLPRILLNLGRSHVAAGEHQRAADALETLRELAPGTPQYVEGTAVLAELLADHGPHAAVFVLADELARLGTDRRMCDWLRARALARLGRLEEALQLLWTIDELVDPVGRVHDAGPVMMLQTDVAEQLGLVDEAVASLVVAMTRYGRIAGQGPRLLRLWGDRPVPWLAELIGSVDHREHFPELLAELQRDPGSGGRLADAIISRLALTPGPPTATRAVTSAGPTG